MKNKIIENLIYAFESPMDGKVYYVGQSIKGLSRPYSHIKNSHNKEVNAWLKSLGVEPIVRILERNIDPTTLLDREKYWINEMIKRKEPLLNKQTPSERQLKYSDYKAGQFLKEKRRGLKLTQKEFAEKTGLGLRFVRDMEQGKESCRMDKVLQALSLFGATLIPMILKDDIR